MSDELDDINEPYYDDATLIALVRKDIKYIRKNVCEIKAALDKNYVTKAEFKPVKLIAYGLVGIAGTSIITWLLYINLGAAVVAK